MVQSLSLKKEIAGAYYNLANLRFKQKRYNDAMDYSKQYIQALSQIDGYDDKVEPHQLTFEINQTIGRQSNAIYHLNQKMAFKDSLMNETKVKETQNLQIQCKGQGNRGKRTSTCFAQHQGEAEQEKADLFHHHLGFVVVLCEPPLL